MSDRSTQDARPYDHNPAAQSSTAQFIDDRTLHAILSEVAQRRAIAVEPLSRNALKIACGEGASTRARRDGLPTLRFMIRSKAPETYSRRSKLNHARVY